MSEDDFKTFLMFGVMLFVWMIIDAKVLRPNVPIYAQLTT